MQRLVRAVRKADLPALKAVLDTIDLFPSEMLEEMMADYLSKPESNDIWFTLAVEGVPVSVAYCAPEQLTVGTYNLYAIGVRQDQQGQGVGQAMMQYIENLLRERGQRILLVETSSSPEQQRACRFYRECGYEQEAVIRDFWDAGEDKLVFWKKL